MDENKKKEGILSHSVKNKLFWSFVYILIFVWGIVIVYQALLGELKDYMLLKTDLRMVHEETNLLKAQTEVAMVINAGAGEDELILADENILHEVLTRIDNTKERLTKRVYWFKNGRPPYKFIILKRRGDEVTQGILGLQDNWMNAAPLLDKLLENKGEMTVEEFGKLLSLLTAMEKIITLDDESDPGLRSSLVSAQSTIKGYYQAGFVVFIILLMMVFVFLYNSFIKPLGKLNEAFDEVKAGNLDLEIELKGDNEFTALAQAFNAMVKELDRSQKEFVRMNSRLKTLFAEREAELNEKRLSLEMAREVQQAIIPLSFNHRKFSIATGFIPFEELSGDFFDIFPLGGKKFALLFGDIMGKGIPASLRMMSFHSLFRATMNENDDVTEAARTINRLEIADPSRQQDAYQLTTAIMGRLDVVDLTLHLVNCGHPPPLMWREIQGDAFELPTSNPIIGFDEDAEFEKMVIDLREGDKLFFYTDGLIEQHNKDGEEFDITRTKETIAKYHDLPPDEFIEAFKKELSDFSGLSDTESFRDDILFCVLHVEKYAWYKVSFPRMDKDAMAESLVDYMRAEDVPNDIISDMNLVFQELITNAFLHGNKEDPSKTIDVGISAGKGEITIYVQDEGKGYDTSEVDFLLDPDKMYGVRGRGLYLVKGIVDEIEFNKVGNRVTVHKKFTPQEGTA